MAEWFKAAVLKTAVGASPPWVRIPPSPPSEFGDAIRFGRRALLLIARAFGGLMKVRRSICLAMLGALIASAAQAEIGRIKSTSGAATVLRLTVLD